ncbi:VWA domain-containing protein [Spirulina sp. CS-785/01]|uniref:vWA domain-containing protein n=1 Tax=Spirulina sp. CS-785/01 TaxID=3021716 RepID=UPI002330035E|nr:VWA domain-containing protein [Spirulina sp. CS-785/01]MDB9313126.1 VWA domain-containing protein [Spirulina sp. CS-785/01]
MSRRLPVYLLLDCSGSMSGEPIEAVRQGIKALLSELRTDPMALETAHLSVITFESTAHQAIPLTDLMSFKEPTIRAGGSTSMGAALQLLEQCLKKEVRKSSPTQKGDWKPLVFLMTDGMPTDRWQQAADRLQKQRTGNIIACAAGSSADEQLLKRITEIVVKLDNLQPDTLKAFFQWVSSSIQATSNSVVQVMEDAPVDLPPPPPQIAIVP